MSRKDLRLEMRIRNNLLWKAIHAEHASVASFCRSIGLEKQQAHVGGLLNLTFSPLLQTGAYRKICEVIARSLRTLPEDLFPPEIYAVTCTKKVLEGDSSTILHLVGDLQTKGLPAPKDSDPAFALEQIEQDRLIHETMEKALNSLSFREREVLKLRYGLDDGYIFTLEEVGRVFNVNRERVRQIEAKAVRKLQHPARAGWLEAAMEDGELPHWGQPVARRLAGVRWGKAAFVHEEKTVLMDGKRVLVNPDLRYIVGTDQVIKGRGSSWEAAFEDADRRGKRKKR